MSLFTQALIVDRYGLRLGVEQMSEILCISKGAIYNQLSAGSFPVPTYLDGGKRWADYRDMAAHLDACRSRAGVDPLA